MLPGAMRLWLDERQLVSTMYRHVHLQSPKRKKLILQLLSCPESRYITTSLPKSLGSSAQVPWPV